MSVDTPGIKEECESRRQREREQWRENCRGGRRQSVRREVESASYSSSYTEVVAVGGRGNEDQRAVEGRQFTQWRGEDEVSVL